MRSEFIWSLVWPGKGGQAELTGTLHRVLLGTYANYTGSFWGLMPTTRPDGVASNDTGLPVSIHWGAPFNGVLIVRALLFEIFFSGPDFWKLPSREPRKPDLALCFQTAIVERASLSGPGSAAQSSSLGSQTWVCCRRSLGMSPSILAPPRRP